MIWTGMFAAGLFAAFCAAWSYGRQRLRGAAMIVVAVWLANFVFAAATGDYTNCQFMFAVDFIAATIILTPPCNVARAVIGVLYIGQVVFHGVYWSYQLRGLEGPGDSYLSGLYLLGACQVAALLIGAFHDRGKKLARRDDVRGGNPIPVASAATRDGARR